MATQFVISFGGTGARVIEALTYLTAAGCYSDPLHVLMIDPDGSNGNLAITVKQLHRYGTLSALHDLPANLSRAPLFSVPINKSDPDSVLWEYPNSSDPFKNLIGYASLPAAQQDLLKLLYHQEDLDRDFKVGYVGRAHVGSADLYRTIRDALGRVASNDDEDTDGANGTYAIDKFFTELRSQSQASETRLFVVGSLFGGTGASGIPIVPSLLSEILPTVREDISVGGLLLGPYFTFPPDDEPRPDSVLHPLATRAALSHYAGTDLGFDSVYFLGSPDRSQTSDGNEWGGANQRNKAHYAEIAAATAASHFFLAEQDDIVGGQLFSSGSEAVTWKDIPGPSNLDLERRMVSLVAAMMLHTGFMAEDFKHVKHTGHHWAKKLEGNEGGPINGREEELGELTDFGLRFLQWARDIEASAAPDSSLINVPEDVKPQALGALLDESKRIAHAYHTFFDALNHASPHAQNGPIARYLDILGQASDRFIQKAYSSRGWAS